MTTELLEPESSPLQNPGSSSPQVKLRLIPLMMGYLGFVASLVLVITLGAVLLEAFAAVTFAVFLAALLIVAIPGVLVLTAASQRRSARQN